MGSGGDGGDGGGDGDGDGGRRISGHGPAPSHLPPPGKNNPVRDKPSLRPYTPHQWIEVRVINI